MSVLIYSTTMCPFCVRAKTWFDVKGIKFEEIVLDNQDAIASFKNDCPGQTTVPQIIINGTLHDGGYDGLMANQAAVLDMLKI